MYLQCQVVQVVNSTMLHSVRLMGRFIMFICLIMYIVGFIMWVAFLSMNNHINTEAWLNTIGAGAGVLLFCLSETVREN